MATNTTDAVTFPTRVDFWLAAVLGIALIVSFSAAVIGFRTDPATGWLGLAMVSGSALLVFVLAVPTEYTIGESDLTIRSGLIRRRVPLASIIRVYPTANPLSAPAWSLDRLGIEYVKRGRIGLALISPAAQHEFLSLLQERAGLQRVGSELRRPE